MDFPKKNKKLRFTGKKKKSAFGKACIKKLYFCVLKSYKQKIINMQLTVSASALKVLALDVLFLAVICLTPAFSHLL